MFTRLKLKDRGKCVTGKGRSFLGWRRDAMSESQSHASPPNNTPCVLRQSVIAPACMEGK